MTLGVVREWHTEDGWGVLESPETPEGCWAHYSSIVMAGYKTLTPGQRVDFEHETPGQDGYAHRATVVRLHT